MTVKYMAKFSDSRLPYNKQDALWDEFCVVIADLKKRDDVKRFLKDLLNRQERLMLIRRLQIADMLEAGMTYEEITRRIGASSPTIARVHRWLKFGRDGYRRAIQKLRQNKR